MKRLIALILATVLTLGMTTVALAAAPKITGMKESIGYNSAIRFTDVVNPKTVWEYPLTANMFEWSDGTAGVKNAPVTTSQLNAAEIAISVSGKDTSMIKDIVFDTKAFSKSNNEKTAYVKVTFIDEYVNLERKDFKITVYLTLKRTRQPVSELILDGTFGNPTVSVDSYDDYVSIAGGKVLVPGTYIKSIDVDLGNGILIRSAVYASKKYYGTAKEKVTYADDFVLTKHPSIETIFVLNTVGFDSAGSAVKLELNNNYYVYSAEGKYLGRANDLVPYSNKYYMSSKQIDMSGSVSAGSGSTSGDASSGSTTSGSEATNNATAAAISITTATSQTEAAIKAAGSAKTVNVRFFDAESISAEALHAMNNAAVKAGVRVKMFADSMSGKDVRGRLIIFTSYTAKLKSGVNLGVYVDENSTGATRKKFEAWFQNKMAIVSLAQKDSYGMTVEIAVKVNLTELNIKSLSFYSYNKSTNKYMLIIKPSYFIDANGYLHFATTQGGEIVITDSPLKRK